MKDHNRALLILDLDETLVFADESPLSRFADFRVERFYVYCRPGLQRFLGEVARHYELAIWSSATDGYVNRIAAQIVPAEISLRFIWARSHCVTVIHPDRGTFGHLKDLKKVKRRGFDLRRVLIVDDTPYKVHRNYGNAIYAACYEGKEADHELELLLRYLKHIADVPDYRKLEKRLWREIAEELS